MQVEPAKIEIAGEAALISKVASIDTEKIVISDMKESGKKIVHLAIPNGVAISNREVTVTVELKPKAQAKGADAP